MKYINFILQTKELSGLVYFLFFLIIKIVELERVILHECDPSLFWNMQMGAMSLSQIVTSSFTMISYVIDDFSRITSTFM